VKKVPLAKIEDTPGADTLVKHVAQRQKWLGQAAEKATKDGRLDASDPKYRMARKRVKRAQRRLRRVRSRVARAGAKTGTPKGDVVAQAQT